MELPNPPTTRPKLTTLTEYPSAAGLAALERQQGAHAEPVLVLVWVRGFNRISRIHTAGSGPALEKENVALKYVSLLAPPRFSFYLF